MGSRICSAPSKRVFFLVGTLFARSKRASLEAGSPLACSLECRKLPLRAWCSSYRRSRAASGKKAARTEASFPLPSSPSFFISRFHCFISVSLRTRGSRKPSLPFRPSRQGASRSLGKGSSPRLRRSAGGGSTAAVVALR